MVRLTFAASEDVLRMVTDNGVAKGDPRTMQRTNEATELILKARHPDTHEPLIPVNAMMIAEIPVINEEFFLPPEMESIIHGEVIGSDAVGGQTDVRQGFYNIVNGSTYLDPTMSYDNPFVDLFLEVQNNTGVLQRKYSYPGFTAGTIRVVGPKAYVPITNTADYLIVQNLAALKKMILSIEYGENNQGDEALKYYNWSIRIIADEIKKFQMDPRWAMKRKGDYERDLRTFAPGSAGWMRARLALTVPGALMMGKEDLLRLQDDAQLRMMEAGVFRGCIEEFNMQITDGHLYFPARVESVLAARLHGETMDIRSLFFKYLENGPGIWDWSCGGRLEDEGDRFFPKSNSYRRTYRAHVGDAGSEITCACKLRWTPKEPGEQLVIRNFEANRVMATAILLEKQEKWNEAQAAIETVTGKMGILQKELGQYLAGIKHTMPSSAGGGRAGMSAVNLGEML